jgi:hypothetical protein
VDELNKRRRAEARAALDSDDPGKWPLFTAAQMIAQFEAGRESVLDPSALAVGVPPRPFDVALDEPDALAYDPDKAYLEEHRTGRTG